MATKADQARIVFYDNSILSGTKIRSRRKTTGIMFYDNSILSGTKISSRISPRFRVFYDNSILSGTKIRQMTTAFNNGFTITQFFQVLK